MTLVFLAVSDKSINNSKCPVIILAAKLKASYGFRLPSAFDIYWHWRHWFSFWRRLPVFALFGIWLLYKLVSKEADYEYIFKLYI